MLFGFLAFFYLLWSLRFGCMAVIRKPSYYRLRAVSLFFLVRRLKRTRQTNYHERDWRSETSARKQNFLLGLPPSFLASRGFAARLRACPPSLNLKKKRDCSQSTLLWLRLYGEKLSPEKGTTLPAESNFSERFYEKRGRPLCPSQELTTALAHALIV